MDRTIEAKKKLSALAQKARPGALKAGGGRHQGNPTPSHRPTPGLNLLGTPDEQRDLLKYLREHGRFWDN